MLHYHEDRKVQDKDGIYTDKDIYLRKEISKVMTNLYNEIKLG